MTRQDWGGDVRWRLYVPSLFDQYNILGDNMSDIEQSLKNLKLPEKAKLLLEHGLTDSEGAVTDKGKRVLWNYILEHYADKLVADLKTVKANEAQEVKLKVDDALKALSSKLNK